MDRYLLIHGRFGRQNLNSSVLAHRLAARHLRACLSLSRRPRKPPRSRVDRQFAYRIFQLSQRNQCHAAFHSLPGPHRSAVH